MGGFWDEISVKSEEKGAKRRKKAQKFAENVRFFAKVRAKRGFFCIFLSLPARLIEDQTRAGEQVKS